MSVAIIGGGAAGLQCAATLLESDYKGSILLFDKNPHLGAKVIISGGGRCNVTTGFFKKQDLIHKYPHGRDFISHAIAQFGPRKIKAWFEDHGVPLKQEADSRVFPVSNKGQDVVGAFEKIFAQYKAIQIKTKERVESIQKADSGFEIVTNLGKYKVENVVLTTGGNAYRHTGSTGDGYAFAQGLGHSITQLGPSLTSFETKDIDFHDLSGISFPQSRVYLPSSKPCDGPLLLTHFGITGPVVFAFSAHIPFYTIDSFHPLTVKWIPDYTKSIDTRKNLLREARKTQGSQSIHSFLKEYFPSRFVEAVLMIYELPMQQILSKYNDDMIHRVSTILGGGIDIHIIGRRSGDEFVTSGGVKTDEINPLTMESLICPGLYFGGEIMDVDGVTGGYNLTSSRSTGRLAGISIADAKKTTN